MKKGNLKDAKNYNFGYCTIGERSRLKLRFKTDIGNMLILLADTPNLYCTSPTKKGHQTFYGELCRNELDNLLETIAFARKCRQHLKRKRSNKPLFLH